MEEAKLNIKKDAQQKIQKKTKSFFGTGLQVEIEESNNNCEVLLILKKQ